jgi:hypothetical protein
MNNIPLVEQFITSTIFTLMHIFPENHWLERTRQKNCIRISKKIRKKNHEIGNNIQVERRINLSENEFIKNYFKRGIPVIFEQGASGWGCTTKWSLDFLKDNYGDELFSLIDSKGLVEAEYDKAENSPGPVLVEKMSAKDFVDSIRAGCRPYLRGCPILETRPELLADLDLAWLKKMRRCFLGISFQTFIGASKRTTPMHNETTSFFFILAEGEKNWTMYPAKALALINPEPEKRGYFFSKVRAKQLDAENYPGLELVDRYVCHLKKGDILYVPAWMWHEVENLSESWGVSYRFTSLRCFFKYPTYAFIRIFFAKPSFAETLYYSFFRSDISKRDKNLLTPKIYFRD